MHTPKEQEKSEGQKFFNSCSCGLGQIDRHSESIERKDSAAKLECIYIAMNTCWFGVENIRRNFDLRNKIDLMQ